MAPRTSVTHFRLGNSHLAIGTDPLTGRRNSALVARQEAGPGDLSCWLGRRGDRPAARQALGRTWQALGLRAACREISSAASPNSSPVPLDLAIIQTPNVSMQTHLSHRHTRPRAECEHGDPVMKSERGDRLRPVCQTWGGPRAPKERRENEAGSRPTKGHRNISLDKPGARIIARIGRTNLRDRYSRKWHRTHPKDGRGCVAGADQRNPRHHRRTVPA
jgi:hypothetical protein